MDITSLRPIILLYTDGSSGVEGATRFQKLVFLSQKEANLSEKYEYEEDMFGPYSRELESDIDVFIEKGLINKYEVYNEVGNPKHIFSLTNSGIRVAKRLLNEDQYDAVFKEINKIKSKYNNEKIGDLLRYVYGKYPEYTTESTLDFDSLFDPDARSQFLIPDTSSDKEPVIKVRNIEKGVLSNGQGFKRVHLNSINNIDVNVEKYEENHNSIYWLTKMGIRTFLQYLRQDPSVIPGSRCEVVVRDEEEERSYIGEYPDLIKSVKQNHSIVFLAVENAEGTFEVTWEKDPYPHTEKNEITILFKSGERSSTEVRSVISQYLSPVLNPNHDFESSNAVPEGDLMVRGTINEIAKTVDQPYEKPIT